MRGCVVLLAEAGATSAEQSVAYDVNQSKKGWRTNEDIKCHVLDRYTE